MKLKATLALGALALLSASTGCITNRTTKGFQTLPPAKQNVTLNSFGQEDKPGIFKKLWPGITPSKKESALDLADGTPSRIDATSLQSPATVSPELLVVAGEMGLAQNRLELAKEYFKRALKMDPQNARALEGLSKAQQVGSAGQPSHRFEQKLPNQNSPEMLPAVSQKSRSKHELENGIRLVSYVEEDSIDSRRRGRGKNPARISIEDLDTASDENEETVSVPSMTLKPAIQIRTSTQRVANPFFGTEKHAMDMAMTEEDQKAESNSIKKIKPLKVKIAASR